MSKPNLAFYSPSYCKFNALVICSQPNVQSKPLKEGTESEQFWDLLGGKCEHPNQKILKITEGDPHLFSCTFLEGRKYEISVNDYHSFCLPRFYFILS